jgi:hypothetical protein
MAQWQHYTFAVDLVAASQYHLQFLKKVDQNKWLFDVLENAIYRYEYIWLPFLNDNYGDDTDWVAPIDIEFVWQAHMLSPSAYADDCLSLYGKVFDHKLIDQNAQHNTETKTRLVWLDRFDCAYDVLEDVLKKKNQPTVYESRIGCDLKAACEAYSTFYYQVSLPHFNDQTFLLAGLERYKKFLHLKRLQPHTQVAPCYLIRLLWYSHRMHPIEYKTDTENIFGFLLNVSDEPQIDQEKYLKRCVSDSITKVTWLDVC